MLTPIVQSLPVSPQSSHVSDLAIAAGGQTTLDSAQISAGKTAHLLKVRASSSVPLKVELQTVLNAVASSTLDVWFPKPGDDSPQHWQRKQHTVVYSATAGLDGFRLVVTNLDPAKSADVYGTVEWDEL